MSSLNTSNPTLFPSAPQSELNAKLWPAVSSSLHKGQWMLGGAVIHEGLCHLTWLCHIICGASDLWTLGPSLCDSQHSYSLPQAWFGMLFSCHRIHGIPADMWARGTMTAEFSLSCKGVPQTQGLLHRRWQHVSCLHFCFLHACVLTIFGPRIYIPEYLYSSLFHLKFFMLIYLF